MAEEQHERLRRFVDEWRGDAFAALDSAADHACTFASREVTDLNRDPVLLRTCFNDDGEVLVDVMNKTSSIFDKVVYVLAFDCIEVSRFRQLAQTEFYPRLLVFGLRPNSEDVPPEGELQKSFATSLSFFNDLIKYISGLRRLIVNLLKQLEAIYRNEAPCPYFLSCHLRTVFSSLVDGLTVIVTVDEIIAQNLNIGHAMSLFTRMLHSVRGDPPRFNMAPENVEELDRAVNDMDNILTSGLFQKCIQEDIHGNLQMVNLKSNKFFLDEFATLIRDSLTQSISRLDSLRERPYDREQLAGVLAIFILYTWMNVDSAPEKKATKLVMDLLKRAPVIHVFCVTQITCLSFLRARLPPWILATSFLRDAQKEAGTVNRAYLTSLDETLSRNSQNMQNELVHWLVSFDSTVSPTVQRLAIHAMLRMRLKQLAQGVFLANRLQYIIRATIDCHVSLGEPLSKDQVRSLRHAAELLQVVRAVYHRRNSETVLAMSNILELAQTQIQKHLLSVKAQLEVEITAGSKSSSLHLFARSFTRGKDVDTKIQDALAAVDLAVEMLQGCPSLQRRTVLHICLDTLFGLNKLSEESVAEILELSLLVDVAVDIHKIVETSTDCSFLYWSREMMPTCFALLYTQTREARSLQHVIGAFKDGIKLLKIGHAEEGVVESYERELGDSIINEVVMPLCRDIETDLRLHVHSAHLKGTVNVNPTKTGVRDLSWLLQVSPLRLDTKYIHIKTRVEMYLNAAFYDHAAVALHNWKTYNEMRQLAQQKYGLELDDIHLPCQTLEQGVDVLDIMRNIHNFVASYTYNLNTQVFIERLSSATFRKHINTISVKHVANSIRTHGAGIISTTVNFTYQFLAQKFVAFSQFLFDDHIKSRLVKENRFSKMLKDTEGNKRREYPVARAQKLNHEIKKLGSNDIGHSYMDQFRMLIAEIGNALGFVRMVRLGGLSYSSLASGHVQEGKNTSFELGSKNLGMAPEAVQAGKLLDAALESQNMSVDDTSYFNILVNVFSQGLQSDDNIHLKEFVFIVPALIINAVEAMVRSKSKFLKRTRSSADALFTDDGFVMGLAYLLKVLGQDKQFDSLYWFDSVRKHYTAEKSRLEEGLDMDSIANGLMGLQIWSQKLASVSEEDAHNIQMAVKRLSAYLMELELIEFNFSGARIFFL